MRPSPPGSTGGSPQTMVPPPNPFAIVPPGARTTTLTAPSVPTTGSRSPGYSSHSYSHSTSPSTASGGIPDHQNHDGSGLIISPTQISSASLNAQKRAYRQRRKDPSCDACRERKVKCDATETSACSECSSRNHKCQFTKETNRRMSSIKQVQDLQSQIAELTQMNTHLRTKVNDLDSVEFERPDSRRRQSDVQFSVRPVQHRVVPPIMHNFDHVRDNIRKHSQGIFQTPHTAEGEPTGTHMNVPEVPSRADFARLSRSYLNSVHEWYPVLHWPTFQQEVDEVYTARSFDGMSREWISLFFAVLACGSLQVEEVHNAPGDYPSKGNGFYDTATQALTPWPSRLSIPHAQAAFLLSLFSQESNLGTNGEMWLAVAVRAAQDLKLHCDHKVGSVLDHEIRRRLWWALYVRDRLTSIETMRPMLIHEDDCETSLPSSVEDRYIQPGGFFRSHKPSPPFAGSLAIIHITNLHTQLYRDLKSSSISATILQSYDDQFSAKASLLPEAYRAGSSAALEVAALPPLFTLLSARYHLYRRNFTPIARPAERAEALSRCLSVAQETAQYISRALHNPPKQELEKSWESRVAPVASNLVCRHLWRCILVLCFRGDYEAALMCLHLSSTMGNTRKINVACVKHIVFFLEVLIDRARKGHNSLQQLENDEEMLAYVSGDVQASTEHSWVWSGTNFAAATSPQRRTLDARSSISSDETMRDAMSSRGTADSPERGVNHAECWLKAEHLMRQLMEESRPRSVTYYPPPHNPLKRVQLATNMHSPARAITTPNPTPSNSSRISIKNII